jgi:hypothetical protein
MLSRQYFPFCPSFRGLEYPNDAHAPPDPHHRGTRASMILPLRLFQVEPGEGMIGLKQGQELLITG